MGYMLSIAIFDTYHLLLSMMTMFCWMLSVSNYLEKNSVFAIPRVQYNIDRLRSIKRLAVLRNGYSLFYFKIIETGQSLFHSCCEVYLL